MNDRLLHARPILAVSAAVFRQARPSSCAAHQPFQPAGRECGNRRDNGRARRELMEEVGIETEIIALTGCGGDFPRKEPNTKRILSSLRSSSAGRATSRA